MNQELVRRMINTSENVPLVDRIRIVNNYGHNLVNSECTVEETRRVVIVGLKGYERLLCITEQRQEQPKVEILIHDWKLEQ